MDATTNLVDRYIASWNETDSARRREAIAAIWADDGAYCDPVQDAAGHAGIEAMIAGFQQRFPGMAFVRSGEVERHHDRLRFTWDLRSPAGERVAAGTDVAVVAADGRLRDIAGFFDQAPVLPDAAREGATA
jgi:hypothetical protein